MNRKKYLIKSIMLSILLSLTVPTAIAARTGFKAMDMGIETISKFFYPSILLQNESVQIGFYKFLYFLIIFSAVNWSLLKVFKDETGKRAAGVISFAFSAIAVWFMPKPVALASAGLITALFNSALPLALAITAIYLAFKVWNGPEWYKHLFGVLVLIFAMILISWVMSIVG